MLSLTQRFSTSVILVLLLLGCEPSDRTPGQWLRGEPIDTLPGNWEFTDDHQEIFVEVSTPYFVPHSVTIWCAQVDGQLFIGARDPDTKQWVSWLKKNRDIRIKIGDKLFEVRADDFSDEQLGAAVRAAYAKKYQLDKPNPTIQYWVIAGRT